MIKLNLISSSYKEVFLDGLNSSDGGGQFFFFWGPNSSEVVSFCKQISKVFCQRMFTFLQELAINRKKKS